MSEVGPRTVMVYGGERPVRLELARLLRVDGYRVLLASTLAEAAKALASGTIDAVGALSPLAGLPGSSGHRGMPIVVVDDGNGDGRAPTDAPAWRERIRRAMVARAGQPTSSA